MEDGSLDTLGLPAGTSSCTLSVLPTWVPRPRWGMALQGSFWIPAPVFMRTSCAGNGTGRLIWVSGPACIAQSRPPCGSSPAAEQDSLRSPENGGQASRSHP